MKLTPREPVDGINTPQDPTFRNLAALVVGAILVVGVFFLFVSFVVDTVVERLDPETERDVFEDLIPAMLSSFGDQGWDESAEEALAPLFGRVLGAAPELPYEFVVRVSCHEEPNALALPGGAIVVTAGLLRILETEEALAFVLGHELGHFVNRDHLRGMGRAAAMQLAFGMMFLTTGIDPTVAIQIALEAFSSAHSREQEVAADELGAGVLAALDGGDVSGAHRALNALGAAGDEGALDSIDFLRSHPVGAVRREALDALIASRGWQESRERGTPLDPALKSACQVKEAKSL